MCMLLGVSVMVVVHMVLMALQVGGGRGAVLPAAGA
jgi:hypothetical protein